MKTSVEILAAAKADLDAAHDELERYAARPAVRGINRRAAGSVQISDGTRWLIWARADEEARRRGDTEPVLPPFPPMRPPGERP